MPARLFKKTENLRVCGIPGPQLQRLAALRKRSLLAQSAQPRARWTGEPAARKEALGKSSERGTSPHFGS